MRVHVLPPLRNAIAAVRFLRVAQIHRLARARAGEGAEGTARPAEAGPAAVQITSASTVGCRASR